ncbi:25091_t:CDS:2, partial [Racocetra persica]
PQDTICISISQIDVNKNNPLRSHKKKSLANSSVIAFGKCHYPENHELTPRDHTCYVSPKFAKQNNFVNGIEVDIINVRPVELDEVIIGALDYESYEILLRDLKDDYMTTQLALLEADGQDELDGDESDYISSVASSDDDSWNNVVPLPTKSKFTPVILSSPFPSKLLQPAPNEKEDPESRILISLKELARLGFQSGSWALVSGPKMEKSRMCK